MKKRKPDPRQIAFDLGLPDEPVSEPEAEAARVTSDWDSLQDHAPSVDARTPAAPPASEPPGLSGDLPTDPDSWTEPVDLCPVVPEQPADEPPIDVALPEGPADFILPTRIAWAGRRPYSLVAAMLQAGDPVRLLRERDNPHDPHAIRILDRDGGTAGYVYAEEAAWLSLLMDLSPPERDDSVVTGNDGRHVAIDIRFHMAEAWTVFTIIAVFGLRSDRFSRQFNLTGNPYLRPLALLNRRFLANYDYFRMPPAIVDAYACLRARFDALQSGGKASLQDSADNTSAR